MWLDQLKEIKKSSGLTTKEIADGSGIPEPTLTKIFAGVTKEPKLTTIQQLVHFFGRSLDDIDDFNLTITDTDPQIDRILNHAKDLNANGLAKLGDYAEDLAGNPAYKKKSRS